MSNLPHHRYPALRFTPSQRASLNTTFRTKIDPFPFKKVESVKIDRCGRVVITISRAWSGELWTIGKRGKVTLYR